MADETKVCPYCGEEILAIAKKCKHCGEFLDESLHSNNQVISNQKFQNVDVNDKWKERFALIDSLVLDCRWWKTNPETWKMPALQRAKLSFKLYSIDPLSALAMLFLGLFYYLFKGMWVKALVYLAISFATGGAGSVLFFFFAPYDYYRLKVLGKQW